MAIILIRTLIIFLALIVAMRLMGKRQLGELELSELVVAVLIADIASIPLQNPSLPLSYGLIPLLVLFCCELIFSGLTYKSIHLRKLLYGRPNFIIERGRIAQQAMHRNRFTLDELTQEAAQSGHSRHCERGIRRARDKRPAQHHPRPGAAAGHSRADAHADRGHRLFLHPHQ